MLFFNMRLTFLLCVLVAELRLFCKAEDYECKNGQTTLVNLTAGQSAWFRTTGFPNHYPVPSPKCIFQFTTPTAGYSVKLFFEQFFTDSNDVLLFCNSLQSSSIFCESLSGDPMDFLRQKLVYPGDQQFFATFYSVSSSIVSQSPPYVNSGFRGKAVAYQRSQEASCSPTSIQLRNGETDIISSPGYPSIYRPNLNCEWTITAPERFRLVFNEFYAMLSDNLTIYDASGNVFKKLYGYQTWDKSFALYMEKSAKLEFQSSSNNGTARGFYITVNAYSSSDPTHSCANSGDYDLAALGDNGLTISTPGFGSTAYPNNLVCQWTARNSKTNSAIVTQLWLETEQCCDILEIRDNINKTLNYRGKQAHIYSLSTASQLSVNFSSDGALASTGFQAIFKAIDCACDSAKDIGLDANTPSVPLSSPGFSAGVGYCNGLQCGWTIRTPPDNFIQISISSLQIRSSFEDDDVNELVIQDQFGVILANYTDQNNSDVALNTLRIAGHFARITFTSGGYFPSSQVARGFALTASMVSSAPTVQVNRSLTEASFVVPIERINDSNTPNYMGVWTARARSGRRIRFYNFAASNPNAQLILYDGPDVGSPVINISQANSNAPIGKVTPVVSSGEFMTVVYFSQSTGDAVRFAALLSDYEDDNYESRCGGFAYVHHSDKSSVVQLENTAVASQQCYSVLYEFRDSGAPSYTDAISFNFQDLGDSLSVFRGIITDAQFLIANSQPYPTEIYGSFVTVQYTGKISLSFNFIALNVPPIKMPQESGVVMSPDFRANGSPQFKQEYLWTGNEKGLVFNLETPLGIGSLVIQSSLYAQTRGSITLPSHSDKRTLNICGTYVTITYDSITANGSGFLASYRQSTENLCKFGNMLRCSIFVAILCAFLAFLPLM